MSVLHFRPEVKTDVAEAAIWYEQQQRGRGMDLTLRVEEALERIRRNPELYGVVRDNVRRATVHRFPYGIFYRIEIDRILVIGVLHARQSPSRWQSRM